MTGGSRPGEAVGLTVYGCAPDEAEVFRDLSPGHEVAPTLVASPLSSETVVAVPANRCVSVGHTAAVSRAELRALSAAGVVHLSTRSIGTDHIDLDAAHDLGIAVENSVYPPDGVADFTLMLILMSLRGGAELVGGVSRERGQVHARGRDLAELTVGVVGAGRIGRAVIRRLQGFGCQVLSCSNGIAPAGAEPTSLHDLLRRSDVVTLHLPLDPGTHHLLGRQQLASMKAGSILVNTGRGALVDTEALVDALDDGRLGGAALDVLEGEEGCLPTDRTPNRVDRRSVSRLHSMPNVIVTPHVAYRTRRMLLETVEETLRRCVAFERKAKGAEDKDRDRVRRVLGGARHLGEVGDGAGDLRRLGGP